VLPREKGPRTADSFATSGGAFAPRAVSVVRREAAHVAEARALVRSGAAAQALDSLAELDAIAPSGVLMQERQSLRIEALMALGRSSEAGRAARLFLEQYPESPHAARVESWLRQPATATSTR